MVTKSRKLPNAAFVRPMVPSEALAAVVGRDPLTRPEVTKRVWEYIKSKELQDKRERSLIRTDAKLAAIFGGDTVSMFQMVKLINGHLRALKPGEDASPESRQTHPAESPDAGDSGRVGSDWSDVEIDAAVEAYLTMMDAHQSGESVNKAAIYRDLEARFGRTAKAFERRMMNISAVLEGAGFKWVPGLVPNRNVGAAVAPRIEAALKRAGVFRRAPDSGEGRPDKAWPMSIPEPAKRRQNAAAVASQAKAPYGPDRTTETGEPLHSGRLPADVLAKATPEFIFDAVQRLLAGEATHSFGESTDYDLVADDGSRLPPKAVFGIALSAALDGASIGPRHFTAGETSPCFRLLRAAGYQVVPKGEAAAPPSGDADSDDDAEWTEGKKRLVSHVKGERKPGLARAKKAQFRRLHGKLACERCGLDPIAEYGTPHAEACIEVHHATTQVSEMLDGHRTTLADLQCLCANCHRLVHRWLRAGEQV